MMLFTDSDCSGFMAGSLSFQGKAALGAPPRWSLPRVRETQAGSLSPPFEFSQTKRRMAEDLTFCGRQERNSDKKATPIVRMMSVAPLKSEIFSLRGFFYGIGRGDLQSMSRVVDRGFM